MPRKPAKRSLFFRFLRLVFFLVAAVALFILGCNLWIVLPALSRIHSSPEGIPPRDVALVLGTSKKVGPNSPNPHFDNRLAAAAKLYSEGKVKRFIVSGHKESAYYSEPRDMRERLVSLGVPTEAIKEDDAGDRTLDSVVRAKKHFGLKEIVIVSDDFHVARALFLARSAGLDAVALTGEPVAYEDSRRSRGREYLARVKAILDIYILRTQPEVPEPPGSTPTAAWDPLPPP